MKIRTKILTAVLAAATAFSCALTASAAPAFTLNNSAAPATVNGTDVSGTLTLEATEFTEVTGALLTVTFPGTVTFAEITDSDWVNGVDYKIDGKTVKLVNVFNIDTTDTSLILNLNFKLSGVNTNNLSVTVSGTYADKQVDKTYPIEVATGTITKGKETDSADDKISAETAIISSVEAGYFIPYGGVYTVGENNAITYYPKTSENAFNITDGATDVKIIKCPVPDDGKVTTFGASKSTITDDQYSLNSIQFGSYLNKKTENNASFGTLIIASYDLSNNLIKAGYKKGSYENAVRYFSSADALFQNIVTAFQTNNKIDGELHPYTYGDTKEVVYAAVVQQTKYMWRDAETYEKLQYAVRCTNLTTDTLKSKYYTAVGYTVDTGNTYKFSKEIQTASYNSLS